jgi:aminoglycoside phosphotransferase
MSERPPDPYRSLLPDTSKICLTHGDLNLGNIIIFGSPGSRKISGIVDWEQSGWYPEYWEYCKLLFADPYTEEWRRDGWADKVMKCYDNEWTAFSEYTIWRCP